MKKPPAVLVTGNAGYIGSVMTASLKRRSYRVVGLDAGWFGKNRFFAAPEDSLPDRQIPKDIRDVKEDDLGGIDAVVHLAALSNDPLGELDPRLTDEINCAATIRLAQACKKKGVGRFIFASSCSIYGKSAAETPIDEAGRLNPITAYAKAKVEAERGLLRLADENFHPVLMRNATVYGVSPNLRLDLVVNNLLAWAYLTSEIAIASDGTPWRPIVHVEDLCSAFLVALSAPADKIHAQAFNVGTDEGNYQVKDIAREVQKAVPEAEIKVLNETGPDERSYRVDFSKIRKILPDFKPRWDLNKGVSQLLDAYERHKLSAADFKGGKYFRLRAIRSLLDSGELNRGLAWSKEVR